MDSHDRNRRRPLLVIVVALVLAAVGCGGVDATGALRIDARIDGQAVSESDAGNPRRLEPDHVYDLDLSMTNVSDAPVTISHIRIEGEMLGLTFLSYDTLFVLELAAGETRELTVPVDFFDLDAQAHGYLRSFLRIYDGSDDRALLVSEEFVLDVRGRPTSTMSVFAFVLLAIAAASLAHNWWALRRRTLPPNRIARGLRFAVSGLAVGLLLSVVCSVLRIFPLPATGWVPLTLLPTAGAFVLGYLLPGRLALDPDDLDDLADYVDSAMRDDADRHVPPPRP